MLRARVLKQIEALKKLKKEFDAEAKHIDLEHAKEFRRVGIVTPSTGTESTGLPTPSKLDDHKKSINDGDFIDADRIQKMERTHRIHSNYLEHRMRSLQLLSAFLSTETYPEFQRIIIGAGVAGTAVFTEVPATVRHQKTAFHFPAILALNDPDNLHQWQKDGSVLAGQPAPAQSPHVFTSRSEDYARETDKKRNPYEFVMTDDLAASIVETQNHLNMQVLNIKAIKIESKSDCEHKDKKDAWLYPKSPLRIVVKIDDQIRHLYTQAVDICTGPGPTRKLNDSQIDPKLAQSLVAKNKLIYGQEGDPLLKGQVIFYGGGARNASIILDILNGAKPGAQVKHWVAIKGDDFDNNRRINRMFRDLDDSKENPMALGSITRVKELKNGKLQITFSAPIKARASKSLPDLTSQTVECDQLVVAIGQVDNPITQNLPSFTPCLYPGIPEVGIMDIPIGTCSKDRRIIAWGAAAATGFGLTKKDWEKVRPLITADARNLPYESSGNAVILRSCANIRLLARMAKNEGVFPSDRMHEKKLDKWVPKDINIATLVQLTELLQSTDKELKLAAAASYAKQIVAERSRNPLGILNIKQLDGILPPKLYEAVKQYYFSYPNALTPQLFEPLLSTQPNVAEKKDERAKQYGLKVFDGTGLHSVETEDSFAFVSEAGETAAQDDQPEDVAKITIVPTVATRA